MQPAHVSYMTIRGLRVIQTLLGHSSIVTTEIYTHVTIRKIKTVHANTQPAGVGENENGLFYMHVEYELDLKGMLPMLKRWNVADPPNTHERWRNNEIEKLEGIRTKLIDDRTPVDQLQ
jgi:endonuclease I